MRLTLSELNYLRSAIRGGASPAQDDYSNQATLMQATQLPTFLRIELPDSSFCAPRSLVPIWKLERTSNWSCVSTAEPWGYQLHTQV